MNHSDDIPAHLFCSQLFSHLDIEDRKAIGAHLEPRDFKKGDHLFREGDKSDGLYIVESGALEITRKQGSGNTMVLTKVSPGQTIGEMALLSSKPRSASARFTEAGTVYRFPQEAYDELEDQNIKVWARIHKGLTSLVCFRFEASNAEIARFMDELPAQSVTTTKFEIRTRSLMSRLFHWG